MTATKRTTVKEVNEHRLAIRKTLITIATPLFIVIILGALTALSTIMSTFTAEKDFKTVESVSDLTGVVKKINKSAYTSSFVEGYKAKYNYATAIAPQNPYNAINLYATEVLPLSPPDFICYPVSNGFYYSTLVGDNAMENGSYMEAEHFYNYSEYFLTAAPQCFSGESSNSDSEDGEQSAGEPEESEQEEENQGDKSEAQKLKEDIQEKQKQAREAQGKEDQQEARNSEKPTEAQKEQNEQRTDSSEKSQKQTKEIRDKEREGEPPTFTDRPW